MKDHQLIIYLDSLRAGHAYLELKKPTDSHGDVYGFYPEQFDEKREVLVGKGMVRKDQSRLEKNSKNDDVIQTGKIVALSRSGYQRVLTFLEDKIEKPHHYFLVGYNCIDFIQDAYAAATEKDSEGFLKLYSRKELNELSWVGVYANLLKPLLD